MKFLKLLILILISANSFAQYTPIRSWQIFDNAGAKNFFIASDTTVVPDISKSYIAIKNAVMYYWNGTAWTAISGTGGGGGGTYTLPQATANILGGIKYNTDFYIDANGRLGIDTSKKNLWNTVVLKANQTALRDTAIALRAAIPTIKQIGYDSADFDTTGNVLKAISHGETEPAYKSSIWYVTDPTSPVYWTNKASTDYVDSSIARINRDTVLFNRRDFKLDTINSKPYVSLAANTQDDGLIKGGVVTYSGTGLAYDVTNASYLINGVFYTSPSGSIALNTADPALDRIDVIGVDTNGAIVKITGTPAVNPLEPQPDPETQIYLASVYVSAGATTPNGFSSLKIYNEQAAGEWAVSGTGITTNAANTTNPFSGSKSLDIGAWTSGDIVAFSNGATVQSTTFGAFKFFIKLKASVASTSSISARFYNGTTAVSNQVSIVNYGLNKSLTTYQNISMPISAFTFSSSTFNKIQLIFGGTGTGAYVDYVELQSGVTTVNTSSYVTSVFKKGADSVFYSRGGVNTFAYLDNSGSTGTFFPLAGGTLSGTGGSGYVGFQPQSSTPATPTSGFKLFATNPGAFAWITSLGYARELRVRAQTQNNIYYLQDKSYTLADSADVAAKENALTFSNPIKRTGNTIFADTTTSITGLVTKGFLASQNFGSGGGGTAEVRQTYTTGTTVTIGNTTTWMVINPASLVSALTITTPATPTDAQRIEISFGGTITSGNVVTALTVAGNTGQSVLQSTSPTSVAAGESISYRYNSSNSKWYRIL